MDSFRLAYPITFTISWGLAVPGIRRWHPAHVVTGGSPASTDLSAEKWQYMQSSLYVPAWMLWGNAIGWIVVSAAAASAAGACCAAAGACCGVALSVVCAWTKA